MNRYQYNPLVGIGKSKWIAFSSKGTRLRLVNENKKKFEDTYGFQVEKPTIPHSAPKPKPRHKKQKHWFLWAITGLTALVVASFMAFSIFIVFAIAVLIRFLLPKKSTSFSIQKKE